MKINIIGDIAGRYDELMALLAKMPGADLVIAVGDLVDRGTQSRQVLEWFMNNPKAIAIYGNHEDMLVKYIKDPKDDISRSIWFNNGGKTTLKSFENALGVVDIPEEIIEWLETKCPIWWKNDELIISHAPLNMNLEAYPLPNSLDHNSHYFFWNRIAPRKRISETLFHIYGHNGKHMSHSDDKGEYAFCIDNSFNSELTGMHWPSKEIFRQKYNKAPARKLSKEEKKKVKEYNDALELLKYFV